MTWRYSDAHIICRPFDSNSIFLYNQSQLVGRLNQPVGHTHRVATEDFTVKMLGRKRTFPKGTIISIPINMSCVNKNLYGETTFEFDHNRPNIAETSTIFHSVGQEHAGRSCPGTGFAMTMVSEILTKCGETRRGTKF